VKLIILDRDGVINEDSDAFIKSPEEWVPIPGSLEAIAQLNRAGFTVAVASNQSGLARGLFNQATLEAMHEKFIKLLAEKGGEVATIQYCPHGPDDGCDCRKPEPGLLHQIASALNADLKGVPVIGDSLRDLQPAEAVGAQPVLVCTGKGADTLAAGNLPEATQVFPDLAAAVAFFTGEA